MRKKLLFALASAVLITWGCLRLGYWIFSLPRIPRHEGDGTFQDISRYAGPLPIRGYSIAMPEFDLGQPFEAEYQLAKLSRIRDKCGVYLAMYSYGERSEEKARSVKGMLDLVLLDSRDQVIASVHGTLQKLVRWESGPLHGLYDMSKSFFDPNPAEHYRIRVTFKPEPGTASYRGFVYLRCGGNI